MTKIYEVTKAHRAAQKLSLRKFTDEINKDLINTSVTYGTVNRWEDEINPYEPDMRLLFECISTYKDWRAKWAADCLQSMWPDLFNSGIVCINLPNGK